MDPRAKLPEQYEHHLGRFRASEKAAFLADFKRKVAQQQTESMARMKDILPPDAYAELEAKIAEIRKPRA